MDLGLRVSQSPRPEPGRRALAASDPALAVRCHRSCHVTDLDRHLADPTFPGPMKVGTQLLRLAEGRELDDAVPAVPLAG